MLLSMIMQEGNGATGNASVRILLNESAHPSVRRGQWHSCDE